jgi:hypothetical protein
MRGARPYSLLVNNNLHYQSAVGIFGTPLIYPNQNGKIIKKFKE